MAAEGGGSASSGPRVHGLDVDGRARCAHHRGARDVVAFRFPCCGRYYACHACHAEAEDHDALRWPRSDFGREAVLCGACGAEVTVDRYLEDPSRCPECAAGFNPRCARHHHLYFEVEAP